MMEGMDRQADLKKSKTRHLASSRVTEFGGTLTARNVNAIFTELTRYQRALNRAGLIRTEESQKFGCEFL